MRKALALSLLLCAGIAMNVFAVGEARISGKILEAGTKKPLTDATITVVSAPGTGKNFKETYKVNKDGAYAIFLLDGTMRYIFTYEAPGHAPYSETMKLKLGEPNLKDVELTLGNVVVAGAAKAVVDPAVAAFNEGATLANEGKDAEAIAKIEEAVAAKPDLTAGWNALARLYLRAKNYPKAIDAAQKSLAIDADDVDMNAVMFDALSATGQKAKAEEYKKKMPANPSVLFNDAAHLINAQKDSEAEPLLKQAIAADEKFAIAYYELGMIYVRSGNAADAKTNLNKYLELEPNGKDAPTAKEMLKYLK